MPTATITTRSQITGPHLNQLASTIPGVMQSIPSVKFVPAFGLHETGRKRRAPYLKR
jgi:hypothetical protein